MGDSVGLTPQQSPDFKTVTDTTVKDIGEKPIVSSQVIKDNQVSLDGIEQPKTYNSSTQFPKLQEPGNVGEVKSKTTSDGLNSPPLNAIQYLGNAAKLTGELLEKQLALVKNMPEGADKVRYMDFLEKVGAALLELQALLKKMQSDDSASARKLSQDQLNVTKEKLKNLQSQQDEINKKHKEESEKAAGAEGGNKALAIFAAISMAVVTLVMAPLLLATPPLGWMVMTLLICEMVDQGQKGVGKEPFMMSKIGEGMGVVATGIMDAVQAMSGNSLSRSEIQEGEAITKFVFVVLLMAAMCTQCPQAFAMGGSSALTEFLNSSKAISGVVKQSGGTEKQAADAEMWTAFAIQMAVMVASIATGAIAALSSAGSMATGLSTKVKMIAEFIELSIALTAAGLSINQNAVAMKRSELLAEIAIMQGTMESDITMKEEIIAIIKKMIQKLLESLEGSSEQVEAISRNLQKNIQSASQVTTQLFSA